MYRRAVNNQEKTTHTDDILNLIQFVMKIVTGRVADQKALQKSDFIKLDLPRV